MTGAMFQPLQSLWGTTREALVLNDRADVRRVPIRIATLTLAATCRRSSCSSLLGPDARHGCGLFHPRRDLAFVEIVRRFEFHAS